jgi:hypothetical protein
MVESSHHSFMDSRIMPPMFFRFSQIDLLVSHSENAYVILPTNALMSLTKGSRYVS